VNESLLSFPLLKPTTFSLVNPHTATTTTKKKKEKKKKGPTTTLKTFDISHAIRIAKKWAGN
jgi:hypothetical protein